MRSIPREDVPVVIDDNGVEVRLRRYLPAQEVIFMMGADGLGPVRRWIQAKRVRQDIRAGKRARPGRPGPSRSDSGGFRSPPVADDLSGGDPTCGNRPAGQRLDRHLAADGFALHQGIEAIAAHAPRSRVRTPALALGRSDFSV